MSTKRFRIAFSFAGEKREFVAQVAGVLAKCFGKEKILYDRYHESLFARYDLGMVLPELYSKESDLIVPVLCEAYDDKRWTGWEWAHIYGLLTPADGHRVMPSHFDRANFWFRSRPGFGLSRRAPFFIALWRLASICVRAPRMRGKASTGGRVFGLKGPWIHTRK